MFEKIRSHINEKSKIYTMIGGLIVTTTVSFISYRVGCQHGVNVTGQVIHKYEPKLFEQVNDLFTKNGLK